MRLLIFHPFIPQRVETLTYDALQSGSGFSGTETAMLEVARYLVGKGHAVTITGIVNSFVSTEGVNMCPISYVNLNEYDVYCPLFYTDLKENIFILSRLNKKCIVWVWMHCFVNEHDIRCIKNMGFRVIGSAPSSFVTSSYIRHDVYESLAPIGNGVNQLFIDTPKGTPQQRKGNWMHHASFERGGLAALRVFDYVKSKSPETCNTFSFASYYTPDHNVIQSMDRDNVRWYKSVPKRKIAELLSMSDYFVYPLVIPDGSVHHDTFGSVILEAIACGAIVITWNVACIPEVYNDVIVQIHPKGGADYDKYAVRATNMWMLTDEATQTLGDTILRLEQNPKEKEKIRQHGMEWAKTFTWDYRGGQYEDWLAAVFSKQ
jgi:glycosyltransferase involved in cell wall biosynthesis